MVIYDPESARVNNPSDNSLRHSPVYQPCSVGSENEQKTILSKERYKVFITGDEKKRKNGYCKYLVKLSRH